MDLKYKNVKKLDLKKWLLGGNSKIYAFILLVTIAAIVVVLMSVGSSGFSGMGGAQTSSQAESDNETNKDNQIQQESSTRYIQHHEMYKVRINKASNFVTVYTMDTSGNYTVVYKQFRCSVSPKIETQITKISYKYSWVRFGDNLYGRFVEKLSSGTYVHSTPYYYQDVYMANKSAYNNLGQSAKLGYIYLSVADSMWIYENCGVDTVVEIYEDANEISPFSGIKYEQATTKYEPTDIEAANNYVPETKASETEEPETKTPSVSGTKETSKGTTENKETTGNKETTANKETTGNGETNGYNKPSETEITAGAQ